MIYIKVNDKEYEANVIYNYSDRNWNERWSKETDGNPIS